MYRFALIIVFNLLSVQLNAAGPSCAQALALESLAPRNNPTVSMTIDEIKEAQNELETAFYDLGDLGQNSGELSPEFLAKADELANLMEVFLRRFGFKTERISINFDDKHQTSAVQIISGPSGNRRISTIVQNVIQKLDVRLIICPEFSVRSPGNAGFIRRLNGNPILILPVSHFVFGDPESTFLSDTFLHEVRHAHFFRRLVMGKQTPYNIEVLSLGDSSITSIRGYRDQYSFEEISTNERQIEHLTRGLTTPSGLETDIASEREVRRRIRLEAFQKAALGHLEQAQEILTLSPLRIRFATEPVTHQTYARVPIYDSLKNEVGRMQIYLVNTRVTDSRAKQLNDLQHYLDYVLSELGPNHR